MYLCVIRIWPFRSPQVFSQRFLGSTRFSEMPNTSCKPGSTSWKITMRGPCMKPARRLPMPPECVRGKLGKLLSSGPSSTKRLREVTIRRASTVVSRLMAQREEGREGTSQAPETYIYSLDHLFLRRGEKSGSREGDKKRDLGNTRRWTEGAGETASAGHRVSASQGTLGCCTQGGLRPTKGLGSGGEPGV